MITEQPKMKCEDQIKYQTRFVIIPIVDVIWVFIYKYA